MSAALRAIGFWSGPWVRSGWPSVDQFIDPHWDPDDRDFIAFYLESGLVARVYMGYSTCRVSLIERQAIHRGSLASVKELTAKIRAFIDGWNHRCHPFTWTKTADEVLKKANRQATSNAAH